jgi:adenylosuccinate lyase
MGLAHADSGQNSHYLQGLLMSLSLAENFIRNAREQHSQQDINASLLKALGELTVEMKRLDDELRRVRRDVQMSRRF